MLAIDVEHFSSPQNQGCRVAYVGGGWRQSRRASEMPLATRPRDDQKPPQHLEFKPSADARRNICVLVVAYSHQPISHRAVPTVVLAFLTKRTVRMDLRRLRRIKRYRPRRRSDVSLRLGSLQL